MKLLHELIEASAQRMPERTALQTRNHRMTYSALQDAVSRASNGLVRNGLVRRDRVATYLPKTEQAVIAMFAASRAGGAFVPVNPVLKSAQVIHILSDSGATVLVTSASRLGSLAADLGRCPDLALIVVVDEVAPETSIDLPILTWQALLDGPEAPMPTIVDADLAAILYTSGSTGRPKGVVLSHRNMVAGAQSVAAYLENRESDCLLAALPFSFDYGFSQLTTAFLTGASVALIDYLVPKDIVAAAKRFEVTGIAAVPPLWIQLAGLEWPESVARKLRYITNSGGAMPQKTLRKLRAALPDTQVFLMYGLTEAFRSTYLPPGEVDLRPTSIGKAIPNAEIMVVRPDGAACEPGEPGELVHRGVHVALGYWKDPERTRERFRPAPQQLNELPMQETAVWSGDTVQMDAEGYLYFVGRDDEMIKTSGYRVSPTEIEEAVYETGLVVEAIAFGVPHPVLGKAIVVVGVAARSIQDATDELLAACRAILPSYMLPAHIDWQDALPRNANGKIDRSGLAAAFVSHFEAGDD
jgi:acyl-CoA ligase (AMP-forming) (exosortase A-associated)